MGRRNSRLMGVDGDYIEGQEDMGQERDMRPQREDTSSAIVSWKWAGDMMQELGYVEAQVEVDKVEEVLTERAEM